MFLTPISLISGQIQYGHHSSWEIAYLNNSLVDTDNLSVFYRVFDAVELIDNIFKAIRSQGHLIRSRSRSFFWALLNYARLMPLHLAQMNEIEKEDPLTWDYLKAGNFAIRKSEIPFTALFDDQNLEQKIKDLQGLGGFVGLTQDEASLDRLVTGTSYLTRIVKNFLESFPLSTSSAPRTEHYQLSGNVCVRLHENALKLRECMELH